MIDDELLAGRAHKNQMKMNASFCIFRMKNGLAQINCCSSSCEKQARNENKKLKRKTENEEEEKKDESITIWC